MAFSWVQSHPDPHSVLSPPGVEVDAPGFLRFYGSAFDVTNGVTVIFGGEDGAANNTAKTWTWDGTVWTDLTPGTSPAAQSNVSMAWHGGSTKVVLFTNNKQTWVWDGSAWTQLTPTNAPSDGFTTFLPGVMCYDSDNDACVMFGGTGDGSPTDNTYTFDGTDWTQEIPGTSPPAADYAGAAIAWDDANSNAVLFGVGASFGNETWIWNGVDWTNAAPGSQPSGRRSTGMVYSAGVAAVVLFGGTDSGGGTLEDTWSWDGVNWANLGFSPPFDLSLDSTPRAVPLVGDVAHNTVVMFGGYTGLTFPIAYGDTWQLTDTGGGGGGTLTPLGSLIIGAKGFASEIPDATLVPDTFVWWSTDTQAYYVAIGGSWYLIGGGGTVSGPIFQIVSSDATVGITNASGPIVDLAVVSGALPPWFQYGGGSPVGSVTPFQKGAVYQDTTNGAFYEAINTTSADWVLVGGKGDQAVPGVYTDAIGTYVVIDGMGVGNARLTDTLALAGTGNGIFYNAGGSDGTQSVAITLGPSGEFNWEMNPDGTTVMPVSFSTVPAVSSASTLALGTAYQNTLGYDVVLTVYLNITVNAGGNVQLGIGPTSTPTQQTLVTGVAVLGFLPVTIYLPNNYYALLSTTTTATIVGQIAMPV